MTPETLVFPDADALADAAADLITRALADAVDRAGRATLALSGGSAPLPAYRRLAERALDWGNVHVFQVDERCVPPDDEASNWRSARAILLDPAGVPEDHAYRMACEADPAAGAEAYEHGLRQFFGGQTPALDVAVMGVGDGGHTASLFPGAPSLKEGARWVLHTEAPPSSPVKDRMTLTLPVLNAAKLVVFIVTGGEKREVVARVLAGLGAEVGEDTLPAARVRPAPGRLVWLMDEAAAPEGVSARP